MLFANIVEISRRVGSTSSRLEKMDLLASLLRQLQPEEVEPAVSFLSGSTRQGRIGVGIATLRAAAAPEAGTPTLEVADIDRLMEAIASVKGSGADRQRRELLHAAMARATVSWWKPLRKPPAWVWSGYGAP
jgi:DNA ligase-1